MTQEQLNEVRALIKIDCLINLKYLDDCGNTCAIGKLAQAAGVLDKDLRVAGSRQIQNVHFSSQIGDRFSLSTYELMRIQEINDNYETPEERRKAILGYLDTLDVN